MTIDPISSSGTKQTESGRHVAWEAWPRAYAVAGEAQGSGARIASDDLRDDLAEITAWFPERSVAELEKLLQQLEQPQLSRRDGQWSVLSSYTAWDRDAGAKQKYHIWVVRIAGILAVLAVVLAILQLPRANWEHLGILDWRISHWIERNFSSANIHSVFELAEVSSAVLAIVAVGLGLFAAFSRMWQVRRLQAEQCRFLKFGYLLRCLTSPGKAQDYLQRGLTRLHALNDPPESNQVRTISKRWVRRDLELVTVEDCAVEHGNQELMPLITEYFLRKRIRYQAAYFQRQAERYEAVEEFSKHLPAGLFFLSLLAAIAHFLVPKLFFTAPHDAGHAANHSGFELACLLLAAILPAIGAGIRTYRGALEFGRNANRFHSLWMLLHEYEVELEKHRQSGRWDDQLLVLRDVEIALEDEHRSWTRLMIEAEWFG